MYGPLAVLCGRYEVNIHQDIMRLTLKPELFEKGEIQLGLRGVLVNVPRNHFVEFKIRVAFFAVAFVENIFSGVVGTPSHNGGL